jgi:hypothetical protein
MRIRTGLDEFVVAAPLLPPEEEHAESETSEITQQATTIEDILSLDCLCIMIFPFALVSALALTCMDPATQTRPSLFSFCCGGSYTG